MLYGIDSDNITKLTTKCEYLRVRRKITAWKSNCHLELFVIGDWASVLYAVWFYTCGW